MEPLSEDSISILVVDDAPDASDQLQSLGYDVPATVLSAEQAVRKVQELHPDLVLMDIRLQGGGDGIAAAREIRARYDVPVVYATAYADDVALQRARAGETFGYLLKPFDERELRTTIEMAIYKHRVERQRTESLAMLSHDIRNPLAVILSYSDVLGDDLQRHDCASAAEILQRLRSTTVSVHRLVTNYLDVCRIESGAMPALLRGEPFALNELLLRVAEQYQAEAARRDVRLEMALASDLPAVDGEQISCERIVTNLLYNALKFTPAGGRVSLGSESRGAEVAMTVADTGRGIPPEELPHLFDKFQGGSASRKEAGTGLGLFIVRTLTEAQRGRVDVESAPGMGSAFTVVLPAHRPLAS
jgi:two-component system, sensor histidine kinase